MTALRHGTDDWTVADLAELPDDGNQYEILDGMLLVTPAPVVRHQVAALRLAVLLDNARREGLSVLIAPVDWQPEKSTSLQPDVLVVRDLDLDAANITAPPELVVEVLSPSTRRKDLLLKRSRYEEAGIPSYWIVDPKEPSLVALELQDGVYTEAARATGGETLDLSLPFPVRITPGALVTG